MLLDSILYRKISILAIYLDINCLFTLSLFTLCLQKCDQEHKILDDDLLIDIPGSAYSGPEVIAQSSSLRICADGGDDKRVSDCAKSCQEPENRRDPVESDGNSKKIHSISCAS